MSGAPLDAFYVPGAHNILGTCDRATGVSSYSNKTLKEIQVDEPKAVQIPLKDAALQVRAACREAYCTGPSRITEEEYQEALDVLPPVNWIMQGSVETFKISERLIGSLTAILVRIGDDYFTLTDDIYLTHTEIFARYGDAFKALQNKS